MCGIVGYTGSRSAVDIGIEGLRRMEYRGYDSAGLAVWLASGDPYRLRTVGRVTSLVSAVNRSVEATCGIFHTRWATHGAPTEDNAHPHADCTQDVFVVHNGIVENYQELRDRLIEQGHRFTSETDSEVLTHLIEEELRRYDEDDRNNPEVLQNAVMRALEHVRGTYGLVVTWRGAPKTIIAARNSSPLLLGVGEDEMLVASDVAAVIPHTKRVVYLEDGDIAYIQPQGYTVRSLQHGSVERAENTVDWDIEDAQKGGYEHFMLKEIMEQPQSLKDTLRGRTMPAEGTVKLGGLEAVEERLRHIDRLIIVSCGTASYAARVGEYMIEEYAGIPVEVEEASEFRYRKPILDEKTALLAVSQSGETADTLAAVREAKRKGVLTLGIVNVVGSTVARETDAGVYNHAGPEIAVASTKAYTSQVAVLVLLTVFLGRQRAMSAVMGRRIVEELQQIPMLVEKVLESHDDVRGLSEKCAFFSNMLFLGRKYNYPTALEGALKMKEISYIHAEGYSAGEMKHGPIALIDERFPTVVVVPSDSVYEKTVSNIQEIRARNGRVLAFATEGNNAIAELVDNVFYIPKTLEMLAPLVAVIPLQLFAYYAAVALGRDVDKPRNLAKSVTVE